MQFIVLFTVLQLVNVIFQTIKTIVTTKSSTLVAALVNAVTFGFYTVIVVYMTNDTLTLFTRCAIIAITNFIGVYISFFIVRKLRKDKLWKIEVVVNSQDAMQLQTQLIMQNILYYTISTHQNKMLLYIYSNNQNESLQIKEILRHYDIQYIILQDKHHL